MVDELYSDFLREKGFECRSYYDSNYRGLEDSDIYYDYSGMADWVWDKLQDGFYVEVNGVRFNPDLVEDEAEAYGIEDYLVESKKIDNVKNKVNEDFATDTSDIDGMVDAVLDFVYTYDFNDACDSDSIDSDTGEFTEDAIEETKEMLMDKDERLADYLNDIIDTLSPGERYDGKIDDIIDYLRGWDNKGGDKLHAMSMKNEDINQEDSSDVDKTNEAYDYDYINTITADQMDDAVEEGYPVKVVINGEYYDYQPTRGMYESLDESEEEKPDDDFVDGEEKTEDKMTESLGGFKKLAVKPFVSEFSKSNDSVQAPAQVEDEVADESFAHDDSM